MNVPIEIPLSVIGIGMLCLIFLMVRPPRRNPGQCPKCGKMGGVYRHPVVVGAIVCRYCRTRLN